MKKLMILLVLSMCTLSYANILSVSPDGTGDYTTIQDAVTAAIDDDTITVRGDLGSYPEGITVSTRVVLLGQGNGCFGVPPTRIDGWVQFNTGSDGSVIAGFYIYRYDYGSYPTVTVSADVEGITIRRCYIGSQNYGGVSVMSGGSAEIEESNLRSSFIWEGSCVHGESGAIINVRNSILTGHIGVSANGSGTTLSIQNCNFLNITAALVDWSSGNNWSIDHCIFWDASGAGEVNGYHVTSYNAIPSSYTAFPYDPTNITMSTTGDSPFENYTSPYNMCPDDLHLHAVNGAALIDAGNPEVSLNDRDGTRRDIGAYGGPYPYVDTHAPDFPFVTMQFAPPSTPVHGVLEVRAAARVGRGE